MMGLLGLTTNPESPIAYSFNTLNFYELVFSTLSLYFFSLAALLTLALCLVVSCLLYLAMAASETAGMLVSMSIWTS